MHHHYNDFFPPVYCYIETHGIRIQSFIATLIVLPSPQDANVPC